MAKEVKVHGHLRVGGALVLESMTELPNPASPGMIAFVDTSTETASAVTLCAYVEFNGVTTWFPLLRNSAKTYYHSQVIPALQWSVNHKFDDNRYWFQAKDTDGNYIYPASVTETDSNTFVVEFAESVAGSLIAICVSDLDVSIINATQVTVGDSVVINDTGILVDGKYLLSEDIVDSKLLAALSAYAPINGSVANNFATKDLVVTGDLTVNGDTVTVNSTTVTTKDNTIVLNDGETGAGVTKGSAGLEVDRGTEAAYLMVFDEVDDLFKVGIAGDLETIATREYVDAAKLAGDDVSAKTFTGAVTCDYSEGGYIAATVTGATALTITGIPNDGKAYGLTFELTNAGSNITWPASVTWLGTAPTLRSTGVSIVTLITRNGGTTYYGSAA